MDSDHCVCPRSYTESQGQLFKFYICTTIHKLTLKSPVLEICEYVEVELLLYHIIYEHSHDFIIMNFQMHQNRKLLYNSAATFNILYTHVVHNLWYIKHFSLKSRWMTEYYLSFWSYKHHSFNNSRKVAANTTTIFCRYQVMVCFDLFSNYINNILHLQVQVIVVPIHTKRQTPCNVTIMFSRQNTPAC